jgi:hypothetical protein
MEEDSVWVLHQLPVQELVPDGALSRLDGPEVRDLHSEFLCTEVWPTHGSGFLNFRVLETVNPGIVVEESSLRSVVFFDNIFNDETRS